MDDLIKYLEGLIESVTEELECDQTSVTFDAFILYDDLNKQLENAKQQQEEIEKVKFKHRMEVYNSTELELEIERLKEALKEIEKTSGNSMLHNFTNEGHSKCVMIAEKTLDE